VVLANWWIAALGAMASVVAMTPNGGSDAAPVAAASARAAGRFVDGAFTSDAGTRRWKLWVPRDYDASARHPLVVMLHGCTQDPDDLARGTRITEHADRQSLLIVLPEQPESANPKKCWNWYDPAHQRRDAGEPALIAGITRQVMSAWSVDPQRVYVAGISAGAAMAANVSISYPDVYAAVALHSGIPYGAASNVMQGVAAMTNGTADPSALVRAGLNAMGPRARPLPVIIVHGADDSVVRVVNAMQTRGAWLMMNALARGDDPASHPPREPERGIDSGARGGEFYRECHGQKTTARECEVVTLIAAGLGHAWSGGSKLGTFTDERGPDATREILRFLLAHAMPASGAPNARRP
jgi:poly(hydroxyalkanoate) depolymerase family esterase